MVSQKQTKTELSQTNLRFIKIFSKKKWTKIFFKKNWNLSWVVPKCSILNCFWETIPWSNIQYNKMETPYGWIFQNIFISPIVKSKNIDDFLCVYRRKNIWLYLWKRKMALQSINYFPETCIHTSFHYGV